MHFFLSRNARADKFGSIFINGVLDPRDSEFIYLVVDFSGNFEILVVENEVGLVTFHEEAAKCLGTTPIAFFVHVVIVKPILQLNKLPQFLEIGVLLKFHLRRVLQKVILDLQLF